LYNNCFDVDVFDNFNRCCAGLGMCKHFSSKIPCRTCFVLSVLFISAKFLSHS
jgi:hypothetical protein